MKKTVKVIIVVVITFVLVEIASLWWWTRTSVQVVESGNVGGLIIGQSKDEILSSTSFEISSISAVPKPDGMGAWWTTRNVGPAEKAIFMDVSTWDLSKTKQELCPSSQPCSSAKAFFAGDILDRVEITCFSCK